MGRERHSCHVQILGIGKERVQLASSRLWVDATVLHCASVEHLATRDMTGQMCAAIQTLLDCSNLKIGDCCTLVFTLPFADIDLLRVSWQADLLEIIPDTPSEISSHEELEV